MWFADALTGRQIALALVVLAGVVLGLLPYVRAATPRRPLGLGVTLAVVAALAQAGSGVISRRALLAMQQAQLAAGGGGRPPNARLDVVASAAFDRLTGGIAVALLVLALVSWAARSRRWARTALAPAPGPAGPDLGWLGERLPDRAWFWVGANALLGPVLGVTALVWALQTIQPGIAQAIAAMAPLIAIPFARWLEGYRPPGRYWAGAVVAAAGLAGLALAG